MPRRAQCQENQCCCPLLNSKPFFPPPSCTIHLDKIFECNQSRCPRSANYVILCFIKFTKFSCTLYRCQKNHMVFLILMHYFVLKVSSICVSQILLCTMGCLFGKLIKVIQPTERLSHSPATEGSMSPEPGAEWAQETNSSFCLVIGDAMRKWTGVC